MRALPRSRTTTRDGHEGGPPGGRPCDRQSCETSARPTRQCVRAVPSDGGGACRSRGTKGRGSFSPGDDLARTVSVFVWEGARQNGLTVTSHFETLAWSRCKQASGDRFGAARATILTEVQ